MAPKPKVVAVAILSPNLKRGSKKAKELKEKFNNALLKVYNDELDPPFPLPPEVFPIMPVNPTGPRRTRR